MWRDRDRDQISLIVRHLINLNWASESISVTCSLLSDLLTVEEQPPGSGATNQLRLQLDVQLPGVKGDAADRTCGETHRRVMSNTGKSVL